MLTWLMQLHLMLKIFVGDAWLAPWIFFENFYSEFLLCKTCTICHTRFIYSFNRRKVRWHIQDIYSFVFYLVRTTFFYFVRRFFFSTISCARLFILYVVFIFYYLVRTTFFISLIVFSFLLYRAHDFIFYNRTLHFKRGYLQTEKRKKRKETKRNGKKKKRKENKEKSNEKKRKKTKRKKTKTK